MARAKTLPPFNPMTFTPRLAVQRTSFAVCLLVAAALPSLAQDAETVPPEISVPTEANPSVGSAEAKPAPKSESLARVESSIVKIFATVRSPDFTRPWSKQSPRQVSGSGVVIEGNRVLTAAHVVLYASQVQIQGSQSGDKISAEIESISPGIDLAVLKLEDEGFFKTHAALSLSTELPAPKDAVMAYGFPTGGTELSITKGIVSRIEFVAYNYDTYGLRIQVDAPINPGNSGGPVLVGDKVIGLARSIVSTAQNIGYIIPAEEIQLFLQDVADGHYDGKPLCYVETQSLENAALRTALKIPAGTTGVMVHAVEGPAARVLKPGDALIRIGDATIDNEGKLKLTDAIRVGSFYLVQKIAKNETVSMTIVRGGKEMKVDVPVEHSHPKLIPYLHGNYPPYFVYGPLVFSVATEDFLQGLTSVTSSRSPNLGASVLHGLTMLDSPLTRRRTDRPTVDEEELVVIPSAFLPHKLTKGYVSAAGRVVAMIDGVHIKSLRHLVELLRDGKGEIVTFELAGRRSETLAFPRQQMIAATDELLNDNGIRSQGSADLLEIWRKGIPPLAAPAATPSVAH